VDGIKVDVVYIWILMLPFLVTSSYHMLRCFLPYWFIAFVFMSSVIAINLIMQDLNFIALCIASFILGLYTKSWKSFGLALIVLFVIIVIGQPIPMLIPVLIGLLILKFIMSKIKKRRAVKKNLAPATAAA
jgi:hypothetical protein